MKQRVSIVIIGRNEEKSITKCFDAAISAAEEIGGGEIIYVDSASTDNTVSVAKSFGVRIVEMKETMKLSPSAGRYVGTQFAKGEFILFVDADTLIYPKFLSNALNHFDKNTELAGVNGWIDDLDENGENLSGIEERSHEITASKWLRGPACFYRKSALEECGSFNPNLLVEEEAELGLRLLKNGWKLSILPIPMACHTRCFHLQSLKSLALTFKRDIEVNRIGAVAKTISYAFKGGFGLSFCWLRLKTTLLFSTLIVAILISLIVPSDFYPLTLSCFAIIIAGLTVLIKKRSLHQTLVFFANKFLSVIDIALGFRKFYLFDPLIYQLDVKEYPSTRTTKF